MKVNKGRLLITTALLLAAVIGVTYAAAANMVSFVEKFETGKVDIRVQQLTVTAEGECEAASDIIEANKDVSYIPRITNMKSDCYVRAKVDIVMDGESKEPLGIEHIYGMSSDWIRQGEYFYCTTALEQGQQTDLFKGIHIPEDWDDEGTDGFSIAVTTEAIQSDNFAPDFSKELPWGAVQLKDLEAGPVCYREAEPVARTGELTYTSAGGFECSAADLFDEFDDLMPGDSCIKTVKLNNKANNPLQMYLDMSSADTVLPEKMKLKVTCSGDTIFDGSMMQACNKGGFVLARIGSGKTEELKLEMELPADAGNEFAEIRDNLVWELKAEEIMGSPVQTGDLNDIVPFAVMVILAGILMAGLFFSRGKERE